MSKRPPKLARGYTKLKEWLFDSDDDTSVPQLPVATSPAVPAHADCISPPPPKRMTSVAALTAKAAPSVTRRESVLPKPRPPPLPCFPSAYATGTDPVHVQSRTSRQPPLAAPAPTPAKGSMRDMGRQCSLPDQMANIMSSAHPYRPGTTMSSMVLYGELLQSTRNQKCHGRVGGEVLSISDRSVVRWWQAGSCDMP